MKMAYMTHYSFGDVVLIKFPFSDGKRAVQRPALVIYDNRDLDLLLCRITTKPSFSETDFKVAGWEEAGLLKVSYARSAKMATLEKGMVNRKLGSLKSFDADKARKILKSMFEL